MYDLFCTWPRCATFLQLLNPWDARSWCLIYNIFLFKIHVWLLGWTVRKYLRNPRLSTEPPDHWFHCVGLATISSDWSAISSEVRMNTLLISCNSVSHRHTNLWSCFSYSTSDSPTSTPGHDMIFEWNSLTSHVPNTILPLPFGAMIFQIQNVSSKSRTCTEF